MTTASLVYKHAQLAEASYGNFWNSASSTVITSNSLVSDVLRDRNNDMSFSLSQAAAFVNKWQVVDHIPDTSTGFSATIFRDTETGANTLSVRGTRATSAADILNDINVIAGDGLAVAQLVDLYNFWQRANTASGADYIAARAVGRLNAGGGTVTYTINWIPSSQLTDVSLRQGTGAMLITPAVLNVTGHSLGGHLATAFTRLFPEIPSKALVVNALGFKIGAPNVDSVFSQLGGAPGFNAAAITNIYGIAGPEFAAMNNSVLQQPGGYEGIFIENGALIFPPAAGHSSVQMTDSAAVYDLFFQLSSQIRNSSPASALATLKPLFEAGSDKAGNSLESVVDSLVNFFKRDYSPLINGLVDDREEFFRRIVSLQELTKNLSENNPEMQVAVLTTMTPQSLALVASGSIAHRYALRELNPFAITGINELYSLRHNQNGELDLYSPSTRSGTLTKAWLEDRSEFLDYKNRYFAADGNTVLRHTRLESLQWVDKTFKGRDGPSDLVINVSGTSRPGLSNPAKIVFGGKDPDVLVGSDIRLGDRLYGEQGNDSLTGRQGDDYLEGGRGYDTYVWNDGDGVDVIVDVDGQGVLVHNGVNVTGGAGYGGGRFRSEDGIFEFLMQDGRLYVNGSVIVEDFRNGDLGITLSGDESMTYIPSPDLGELPDPSRGLGSIGDDYFLAGQFDANPNGEPGDAFSSEVFNALSGDDIVDTTVNTADRYRVIFGGSGDDQLHAHSAPTETTWRFSGSYLYGEGGQDFIYGGTGDDVIYGDASPEPEYLRSKLGASPLQEIVGFTIDYQGMYGGSGVPSSYIRYLHVLTEYVREADTLNIYDTSQPHASPLQSINNLGGWMGALGYLGFGGELGDVSHNDALYGGDGHDVMYGGAGADHMEGGSGNDRLYGSYGAENTAFRFVSEFDSGFSPTWTDSGGDLLLGGDGDDYLADADHAPVFNTLDGGGGNDVLRVSHQFSDYVEDVLTETPISAVSALRGGEGEDFLAVDGMGMFLLDGGAGADTYWIEDLAGTVVIEGQADLSEDFLLISTNRLPQSSELQTVTTLEEFLAHPFFSPVFQSSLGSSLPSSQFFPPPVFQRVNDDLLIQGHTYVRDWFSDADHKLQSIVFAPDVFFDDAVPADQSWRYSVDWSWSGGISIDASIVDAAVDYTPNLVVGENQHDELVGGSGSDYQYGGEGNDLIIGGDGNDLLDGESGDDVLIGDAGRDELFGGPGIDLLSGGADEDYLIGDSGRGVLDGGDSGDAISILGGNYFVIGGAGNDAIKVASEGSIVSFNPDDGSDRITVSANFVLSIGGQIKPEDLTLRSLGDDLLLEVGSAGSIRLSREYDIEGEPLPWKQITLQLFGSAHLYDFNAAIAALDAGGSATLALAEVLPTLEFTFSESEGLGGLLAETYQSQGSLDSLSEAQIRSVLAHPGFGSVLQALYQGLTLIGTDAADDLNGGPGNDLLDGRVGADTMRGNAGNDRYVVDQTGDVVIELANEGRDSVSSSVTYTLANNVEVLTLTGEAGINATGNTLDNELIGNAGNNRLDGRSGTDVMRGGLGNDTYVIDNAGDFVEELADGGSDVVLSSIDYTLTAHVENLSLSGNAISGMGNSAANRLTGNARDNLLQGLGGDDVLNGGAGADTLMGGSGDDLYVIDNLGDQVVELSGEGVDSVQSSVSHTLADHIEHLTLTGSAASQGSGNALDNRLTGNAANNILNGHTGNDTLDGKAGADQMAGGLGDDLYIVDQAGDALTELADEGSDTVNSAVSWTLGENFEHLTLTGAALIDATGNSLNNQLTGNNAVNTLSGLDGDDWLDGKGGADVMNGGAGNDTYVAGSGDVLVEAADGGIDTVRTAGTWTLGEQLEHLVLTGSANIRGTGNTLANTLIGNAGNNQLDGRLGADVMAGGAGNDTYIVDDAGDELIELAEQGVDTVRTTVSRTLEAHIENLVLSGTAAISGTGNALANVLSGNAAANTLSGGDGNDIINGGAGADTLIGGTGNDLYTVDNAGDAVIEAAGGGNDTVQTALNHTLAAHVENLVLTGGGNRSASGNGLDNIISGNRGANVINGLAGNDTLAGGLGNDTYRFDAGFGRDVIAEDDATPGNLDRIVFGAGITADQISLGRLNDDLVLETSDRQNSIQIADWFAAARHQIERIEFAGGSFWDVAAIESRAMQSVDMPGLMRGDNDASELLGQIGNTLIEGQGGADILTDGEGNNLFSGGAGNDVVTGGDGNDLFVGGAGNDVINTGGGSNIVAFNAGSGSDTVFSDADAQNTLSLGGGLRYGDLSLSRSGNDLQLNAGGDDKLVLKDWYAGRNNVVNLQMVIDATAEFDAAAEDPVYNQRVQRFDFRGMVNAFDAAKASNPGISAWALSDALTQFHLQGSNDGAIGGDLAYWYGRNGALTGIGVSAAQQIIGMPGFGSEAQSLREFSGLQDGLIRLG